MQAVRHHPPGGTEKLRIAQEAIPEIDDDEVLVKVHAASVIWMELYWQIYQKDDGTYKTPILGEDYSGVIAKVGSKAPSDSGLQVGTEVMVFMSKAFPTKRSINGGMAGYAKAHFSKMVNKPRSLSLTDAASVPLSALTAWQGLFDHAKLAAGQTLLVTGAAGPTAIWAVQMGKMVGARVVGTASSEQSFELLKSLGVDQILNYKQAKLDSVLENVDVVFDTVSGDTSRQALKTLRKDGILLHLVGKPPDDIGRDPRVIFFIVDMDAEQLAKIGDSIDKGKLKPVVDSVFDFNDVVEAFKKGETGHAHGKIVLKGPNV
ncbi:zinc-binding dehydrogenase domain-containing protein [Penicillium samsonianum]|uniref:zinc-binding dehydrogenase domain-containing protein n=1 Tax=Penicillium samsonianum TaxID=1882272 RepID=UPI002548F69E|nr:zinc-binding dehydrogenase domain-containing protein [Penicillium samsonianum]KAJ6131689.1 zinc-binding dehydrogenase domain-containing protein [Penicillium samsonianum]